MKAKSFSNLFFLISFLLALIVGCSVEDDSKTGCDCESKETITGSAILSPSNDSYSFSVYNEKGGFVADGACHANMTIKFYWADSASAATNERPAITYQFESVFGYFLYDETSNFDGKKYVFQSNVNEADDKSHPQGSSYGIRVEYDANNANQRQIICEFKIVYLTYDQSAWDNGCK